MKIFFGEGFLNGVRPLFDDKNRKKLGDRELLADFDALMIASNYLKKSGAIIEVSGREQRACENLWANFSDAINGEQGASQKFNSIQGFKELLYTEALVLNAVNERILSLEQSLVAANTKKSPLFKKSVKVASKELKQENGKIVDSNEKAVYKRNRDEAVAVWGILGARVMKNYYMYQMAVNNRNGRPNEQIVVNGKNITNIMQKLYHGKFTKIYPISEYKDRDQKFATELPKIVAESRRDLVTTLHGMYDNLTREVIFGRVEPYTTSDDEKCFYTFEQDVEEGKFSKFGKKVVAGTLAASMIFNTVGYPISMMLDEEERENPPVVVPSEPIITPIPEENGNIVITDDPNMVAPNPAEEDEEVQENIGENGTIVPDEEPEQDNGGENNQEKDPSYDQPNDPVPDENRTNTDKGKDTSEDFWIMN